MKKPTIKDVLAPGAKGEDNETISRSNLAAIDDLETTSSRQDTDDKILHHKTLQHGYTLPDLGISSDALEALQAEPLTESTGPTSPGTPPDEETHSPDEAEEARSLTSAMAGLADYPRMFKIDGEKTDLLPPPDALRLGLGVQPLAEATREHRIDLSLLEPPGVSQPDATEPPLVERTIEQDPLLGRTFGNFRVIKKVGHGGFGTVYKAEHKELRQAVALKVLRISQQSHPETVERFQREAQAMSRLNHENIVRFYDFGVLEDVGFYLVMEYLQGQGLDRALTPTALWSNQEVLQIISMLCDALTCVHERGLIHRDLKPSNIFLCEPTSSQQPQHVAKLLDFGIVGLTDGSSELTSTGAFLGTAQYVSPEQARGLDTIDARTDLYSLGVILFRMLTGKLPFEANTKMDIIVKHIHQPIPTLTESAPWKTWSLPLEHLIQTVLAKEPADRPADAQTLKALLHQAFAEQEKLEREDSTIVDGASGSQAHLDTFVSMQNEETTPLEQAEMVRALQEKIKHLAPFAQDDDNDKEKRLLWLAVAVAAVIIGLFWYSCGL